VLESAGVPDPVPRASEEIREELTIEQLQERVTAMESLLDLGGDPDSALPGRSAQSLYRQITTGGKPADSGRDFPVSKRAEILRLSHQVYSLRGDAHNIIEIVIDFVIGDDLSPKAEDETDKVLQKAIDDIWHDPRNKMIENVEYYIRSTLLEGELHLIAEMSQEDGHCEHSYLQPERVAAVRKDDRGRDNFLDVADPEEANATLTYFVLNNVDEKITIDRIDAGKNARYKVTEATDKGSSSIQVHGLIYSFFNNRPLGGTRGRPWLVEVLDYIDLHDELIWTQVEREKLLKLFILDITADDVTTAEEGEQKLRDMGILSPPEDPVTLIHNDKVKVKLEAPETSGRPTMELEQILRYSIYGAKGLPEHWSGAGGGSNFATARAQDIVPLRRLRRKQRQFINLFLTIIKTELKLRRDKGSIKIGDEPEFDLAYLEVGGRDRQRGATILKDLMIALSSASSILKKEAANEILVQAVREAGFSIGDKNLGLPPEQEFDDVVGKIQRRLGQAAGASRQQSARGEEEGGDAPEDLRNARSA
jgi:hypothetical protein